MPSRVSQSQDTAMPDASATGDDNGPSQQSIIDLGEQRIRVVSQPTVTGQGSPITNTVSEATWRE